MTPAFSIIANKKDVTATIARHFVSLSITDESGDQSDSLTLEVEDSDEVLDIPANGAVLDVSIGYGSALVSMGKFVVDKVVAVGPPSHLRITGKAAPFAIASGFQPLQTRHERSFDNITLGNLVKTLAAEHGLEAVVEASLAAVNLGHVDQTNESNISLLSRLSRDIGGVVKPTYGKLVVAKTGSGKSVSGLAMPRITLPKSDLSSWEIGFAARPAFVSVECQFHDVGSATPGTYSVSSSTTTSVPKFRLNRMMADLPEASRTARALLDRFQREGQTFEVTLPGRTDILAETVIELDGMRKRLVGPWLVTRAVHTLGRGGYTVSASGEAFFG